MARRPLSRRPGSRAASSGSSRSGLRHRGAAVEPIPGADTQRDVARPKPVVRWSHESPAPRPAPPQFAPQPATERPYAFPESYGEDRIVAMVKDPWWLYAYWEIRPETERAARRQLSPDEVAGLQSALRVWDVTDRNLTGSPPPPSFEIPLSGMARDWYLHTGAPHHAYVVEIGLLTGTGRFLRLAQSDRVTTPAFGPSPVTDEQWAVSDDVYWQLFGLATGIEGASSADLQRMVDQQAASHGLTSGGLFSLGGHGAFKPSAKEARTVELAVKAELVVSISTDPKAHVTIQGQSVTVRPDGTVSVRSELPDGMQTIPVESTTPDGKRQHLILSVTRQTAGGSPSPHPSQPAPCPPGITPPGDEAGEDRGGSPS